MATCPVRFDFNTELQGKLNYVHNVPRSLVIPTAQAAQRDAEYVKNFVNTIQPIMQEHEDACRAASNPKCQSCGSPTVKRYVPYRPSPAAVLRRVVVLRDR